MMRKYKLGCHKRQINFSALIKIFLIVTACLNFSYALTKSGQKPSHQRRNKSNQSYNQAARIEHLGFNVSDPNAVAEWYVQNLGMKIIRKDNNSPFVTFIADKGKHVIMEFYNKDKFPKIDFNKINYMSFHFAFMVDSIEVSKSKLISNGAKVMEDISALPSGDKVLMMRDPWGMPLQLVKRVNPMLKFTNIRPEHFATNTTDSRAKAKWYADNLGMDILRQGGLPDYGTFVADSGKDMMLELYQKKEFPFIDYNKINPVSIHLAFVVNNVGVYKKKLLNGGAKLVNDIPKSASGDKVLVMRDPWGFPIQLIQRAVPLLP